MDSNLMCYEVANGTRNFCKGFNQEGNHCWFCSENDLASNSKLKTCTQKNFQKNVFHRFSKSTDFKVFENVKDVSVFYKYDGDSEYQIIGDIAKAKIDDCAVVFTCNIKLKSDIKIAEIEKFMFSVNCRPIVGYKSEDHQNPKVISCFLN